VDGAGNLYFGSEDAKIYSLTPLGLLRFDFDRMLSDGGTCALPSSGHLYFTSDTGDVYSVVLEPPSALVLGLGLLGLLVYRWPGRRGARRGKSAGGPG
jgi:hypothetical protein